jgi:hypothetical protein
MVVEPHLFRCLSTCASLKGPAHYGVVVVFANCAGRVVIRRSHDAELPHMQHRLRRSVEIAVVALVVAVAF